MSKNRFFLEFSYDGTNYHGWQIQQNAHSVQAEIEQMLSVIFQEDTPIVGAGRTDTGVHAEQLFAHTDLENIPKNFLWRANNILPKDIALKNVLQVQHTAHARFDASSRRYKYIINREKNVFMQNRSYFLHRELNVAKMNSAAELLLGKKDFSSFSKAHTQTLTNICEITEAKWVEEGDLMIFYISANRFLRNMVRAIVGTLLEVGEGSLEVGHINEIIAAKERSKAGFSVPAHGLYLNSIKYPSTLFI